ncbi:MAG: hypothetical protein IT463_11880 [Planctomycetes bacterium]|nr:hypothetical protein [Planctomycetota bacterium]
MRFRAALGAALLMALLPAFATRADAPAVPLQDGAAKVRTVDSTHYRLVTDSPDDTAREYSTVLELAWPLMKEFFGGEPGLKKDERLRVSFMETQEGWHQQLRADGVEIPVGAGGYYWPGTRTVYLYRQPTLYNSRQLLLHEAMHQFHFIASCRNESPKDTWYIEGLVEHLSRHYWDGKNLTLGVIPTGTLENYPAKALDLMEAKDYRLGDMIDGARASARPEQWALVRYLALTDDARRQKAWQKLRKNLDAGQQARQCFRQCLGDPKELQPKIVEWLRTQQEPFVPVWNEWQGAGPDALWGTSAVTSAARLRADAKGITATMLVPEGSYKGGLLLGYADNSEYTVMLLDHNGSFSVNRRNADQWKVLLTGRAPAPTAAGLRKLEAVRTATGYALTVDGTPLGEVECPEGKLGVALENCTLRFTEVKAG